MTARCSDGGGFTFRNISPGVGVDGVMLHQDDDAYFTFSLPGGSEALITLDHDFETGTRDFDIFVTEGATFGTSCATSTVCGFSGAAAGESIRIAPVSSARTMRVHLNAYGGAGRYRLAILRPRDVYSMVSSVDLGYEGLANAGSPNDLRAKGSWGQAERWMLAATDGQYRTNSTVTVTRDISCFSCYEVVYREGNVGAGCLPGKNNWSFFGAYNEIAGGFWKGGVWTADDGTTCSLGTPMSRVGEVIVHEWGHYEFGMCDERGSATGQAAWCPAVSSGTGNRCGFSLMAGSGFANFTDGNRHFEFCDIDAHQGVDPATGQPAMTGDDNWKDLTDYHSGFTSPGGFGDFAQLNRLGQMMETGSFVTYLGP